MLGLFRTVGTRSALAAVTVTRAPFARRCALGQGGAGLARFHDAFGTGIGAFAAAALTTSTAPARASLTILAFPTFLCGFHSGCFCRGVG